MDICDRCKRSAEETEALVDVVSISITSKNLLYTFKRHQVDEGDGTKEVLCLDCFSTMLRNMGCSEDFINREIEIFKPIKKVEIRHELV
jgi:hypothetical protein